jgi:beta-mannosidase
MLAKKANFNMIRVWGGGVVEKEIFYKLCDEFGILIWHDFQFACSLYPEDEKYLANVETEISGIITRLRNHPSIVLWCGNNENEWIYFQHYTEDYRKEKKIGEKLHQLKNKLCRKLDPSRPYWRSSPWSPTSESSYFFNPNSQKEGNCHDWYVWHGVNQPKGEPPEYEYYASNNARFITEFGIQSFPGIPTINKIFSEVNQSSPNDIWEFHNCNLEKIKVNLRKFGEPQNIDDWILYSQAAQAFGMKFAIETWRSRKFETAGALIWQFNEPWPTICWSLVDYYNIPKMAYYFTKRAFEPVIPVYDFSSNKIIIINDLTEIETDLMIKIYSIRGSLELKEQQKVKVSKNSKEIVEVCRKVKEDEYLWIHLQYEGTYYDNLILGDNPSKIEFPNPKILVELEENDQILTLSSKELAFLLQLPLELEPSDNYFHLFPSYPQRIQLKKLPPTKSIEIKIWNYGSQTFPIKIKY